MTSISVNLREEIRALRASETAKESECQACKAEHQTCKAEVGAYKTRVDAHKARIKVLETQLKLCIAMVTNGRGPVQVSNTLKGNALQTPTYNGAILLKA